jgi:hypothetical protein
MLSCPLVILPLVIVPPLSEFESSDAPLGSPQAVSQGGGRRCPLVASGSAFGLVKSKKSLGLCPQVGKFPVLYENCAIPGNGFTDTN